MAGRRSLNLLNDDENLNPGGFARSGIRSYRDDDDDMMTSPRSFLRSGHEWRSDRFDKSDSFVPASSVDRTVKGNDNFDALLQGRGRPAKKDQGPTDSTFHGTGGFDPARLPRVRGGGIIHGAHGAGLSVTAGPAGPGVNDATPESIFGKGQQETDADGDNDNPSIGSGTIKHYS